MPSDASPKPVSATLASPPAIWPVPSVARASSLPPWLALRSCCPGESGPNLWRGNFNKLVKWPEAVAAVGVLDCTFTTLRHTGNTLASRAPGMSLRDIMARMGHDSPRAALIYQHASREADQGIADAIDQAVKAARRKPSKRRVKRATEGDGPATPAS